jgi:hypothetical protein
MQHGWLCDELDDFGEDLLVRIYADGRSTGVTCLVQLKSTRALSGHSIVRNAVGYPMPTKDLLHWEDSVPPIVLVLWAIEDLEAAERRKEVLLARYFPRGGAEVM